MGAAIHLACDSQRNRSKANDRFRAIWAATLTDRSCLGLCDACPYAPACALILPSRAGVAQAPMEETAAYFAAVAKAMGI